LNNSLHLQTVSNCEQHVGTEKTGFILSQAFFENKQMLSISLLLDRLRLDDTYYEDVSKALHSNWQFNRYWTSSVVEKTRISKSEIRNNIKILMFEIQNK